MNRLHELIGAAITIAENMQTVRGPLDDPRPAALVVLLTQARDMDLTTPPPPAAPRVAVCRCGLAVSEMNWHPTDNMNICPRCSAPLRG